MSTCAFMDLWMEYFRLWAVEHGTAAARIWPWMLLQLSGIMKAKTGEKDKLHEFMEERSGAS